ncbi:hypothetical protein EJ04DRAFT_582430 [Polyplosphaeria fusca]|uniref:Uncharacterized protein n=1 Tax=Polyplosphaeria fusca TaxID=682080 RepID=A0A9P4UW64_9PLEO|nr:hypothetical protein EJ04DRAFT_582430 [Polyplosphaeria fusca]
MSTVLALASSFASAVPSSIVLPNPAETFFAGSPGAGNRDFGYAVLQTECSSSGKTCQSACGSSFSGCWGLPNATGCLDTSARESCCNPTAAHARGATCQSGYYCAEVTTDFEDGLFCCKQSTSLRECKESVIDVARGSATPVAVTAVKIVGGDAPTSAVPQQTTVEVPTEDDGKKSEVGIIVGSVLGGVFLFILLILLALLVWRRQERHMEATQRAKEAETQDSEIDLPPSYRTSMLEGMIWEIGRRSPNEVDGHARTDLGGQRGIELDGQQRFELPAQPKS